MKLKTKIVLPGIIVIIGLGLVSCDIFKGNSKFIRIHNASEYDFQRVEVNTYDRLKYYGNIKSGEKSHNDVFEIAYRYAYVRLFISDNEFIIQPIDFVGERPLGAGGFTYVLEVTDFENRRLSIRTQKD